MNKMKSVNRLIGPDLTDEQCKEAILQMEKVQRIVRTTRLGFDQKRPKDWRQSKFDWTCHIIFIIATVRLYLLFFFSNPRMNLILGDMFANDAVRYQFSGVLAIGATTFAGFHFTWRWMEATNQISGYTIQQNILRYGFRSKALLLTNRDCIRLRRIIWALSVAVAICGAISYTWIVPGCIYFIIRNYLINKWLLLTISQSIWLAMTLTFGLPAICSVPFVGCALYIIVIYAELRLNYVIKYGQFLCKRKGQISIKHYLKFLKLENKALKWIYTTKHQGRVICFVGYYFAAYLADFGLYSGLFAKTGNPSLDNILIFLAFGLLGSVASLVRLAAQVSAKVDLCYQTHHAILRHSGSEIRCDRKLTFKTCAQLDQAGLEPRVGYYVGESFRMDKYNLLIFVLENACNLLLFLSTFGVPKQVSAGNDL